MSVHLQHALHNEEFHTLICDRFPTNFFDWKITVLFYCALHYLKALAEIRDIDLGETHSEIEKHINPQRHSPRMAIKKWAWLEYKSLYQYSRSSRYEGITDFKTFQSWMEQDYKMASKNMENFKKYLKEQGLSI